MELTYYMHFQVLCNEKEELSGARDHSVLKTEQSFLTLTNWIGSRVLSVISIYSNTFQSSYSFHSLQMIYNNWNLSPLFNTHIHVILAAIKGQWFPKCNILNFHGFAKPLFLTTVVFFVPLGKEKSWRTDSGYSVVLSAHCYKWHCLNTYRYTYCTCIRCTIQSLLNCTERVFNTSTSPPVSIYYLSKSWFMTVFFIGL